MQRSTSIACSMQYIALACMNHDARCTKLAELFTALHTTQLHNLHKWHYWPTAQNKQLKASNAKNGSHEFPEFLLEKFRNFGTWEKTEFPEIRKSEFPELQSLTPQSTSRLGWGGDTLPQTPPSRRLRRLHFRAFSTRLDYRVAVPTSWA